MKEMTSLWGAIMLLSCCVAIDCQSSGESSSSGSGGTTGSGGAAGAAGTGGGGQAGSVGSGGAGGTAGNTGQTGGSAGVGGSAGTGGNGGGSGASGSGGVSEGGTTCPSQAPEKNSVCTQPMTCNYSHQVCICTPRNTGTVWYCAPTPGK